MARLFKRGILTSECHFVLCRLAKVGLRSSRSKDCTLLRARGKATDQDWDVRIPSDAAVLGRKWKTSAAGMGFFCALCLAATNALSQTGSYLAEGYLAGRSVHEVPERDIFRYEFRLTSRGDHWSLEAVDTNVQTEGGVKLRRKREFMCDGTNVYAYTRIEGTGGVPPMEQASISGSPLPAFDENLRVLWLLFLSDSYIDRFGSEGLPTPFDPRIVPAHTRIGTNGSSNRQFQFFSAAGPTRGGTQVLLGSLAARATTNLNGKKIPTWFGMDVYAASPGAKQVLWAQYEGRASVRQAGVDGVVDLPAVPVGTTVLDRRFGTDHRAEPFIVQYQAPSPAFLPTNDSRLRALVSARLEEIEAQLNKRKKAAFRKVATVWVVLLLSAGPIAYLLFHWTRRAKFRVFTR